jgi:pilus assembly protein Flp/PilA
MSSDGIGPPPVVWRNIMVNFLKNYWNDQSGAAAAEYTLILAIIGSAIAASALLLGNEIASALDRAADTIAAQTY